MNVPYEESLAGRVAVPTAVPVSKTLADLTAWPWVGVAAFLVLAAEWGLARRRGV